MSVDENNTITTETDVFDYDSLEQSLEADLKDSLHKIDLLEEEKQKIGNAEYLGNTIMQVVWDQIIMQIGSVAGDDFIRENRGLPLDLSKSAHIQTTENFASGKIASHNASIDYQQRYDEWQDSFVINKKGENVIANATRSEFDKSRPKGSKTVNIDHTVPVAEIVRDPKAAAHLSKDEKIAFANSDSNLNPLDREANISKSDKPMKEWLDSERDGKTPDERFVGVNREELLKKDEEAREEYEKHKDEGEQRSIEAGKQSRKAEAFRIGGKALRSAVMVALANWIRILIGKLIAWLKQKEKALQTLIDKVRESVKEFINNLKQTVINMTEAVASTLLTAIGNPIVKLIQKLWMVLKQGGRSIKEAIDYISNPENKNKPFSLMIMEIGKIVVAGLTAIGSLLIGEVIEKGLMVIPGFAFEIPLIGSLASIIGMFLGAVISGIAGALILRWIDSMIAAQARESVALQQSEKRNAIISTSAQLVALNEEKLDQIKAKTGTSISQRHTESAEQIDNILEEVDSEDNENTLGQINDLLAQI